MWGLLALGIGAGIILLGLTRGKCRPPMELWQDVDMSGVPAHAAIDPRREVPKGIVVHTTEGGDEGSNDRRIRRWRELATGDRNVLTHFEVRKNGTIICFCPPIHVMCWHAGSVNDIAVGIDLSNAIGDGNPRGQDGDLSFWPSAQLEALVRLVNCCELCNLPIVGHGTHLDPANRHDPGKDFPWYLLDCSRVINCFPDCWDRKCAGVGKDDLRAAYAAIQRRGRSSSYSWRDIAIDATEVFLGEHNAGLV